MIIKAVRGTRDIFGDDANKMEFIQSKARNISSLFGYEEIITPLFERIELFYRGIGENTDIISKEMYAFVDKKERRLALRPENTAGVVRALIEHNIVKTQPVSRWFYFGPMFRYERPQTGRYRQFWQYGVECFGIAEPDIDVEIIDIAMRFLNSLGVPDINLNINSIGCNKCRASFRQELINYFTPLSDKLCPNCSTRLKTNPIRILDCKVETCQSYFTASPVPIDFLCDECKNHYYRLKKLLELYNIPFLENKRLVRGLDYYTRTVFEITGERQGSQNALLAGGRYDGLVKELNGPDTPAVGFAAGIDRLILEMNEEYLSNRKAKFFAIWTSEKSKDFLHKFIRDLRDKGIKIIWALNNKSVKAQFKLADKSGAEIAIILGDDEIDKNIIKLKYLKENRKEEILPLEKIGDFCKDYEKN